MSDFYADPVVPLFYIFFYSFIPVWDFLKEQKDRGLGKSKNKHTS